MNCAVWEVSVSAGPVVQGMRMRMHGGRSRSVCAGGLTCASRGAALRELSSVQGRRSPYLIFAEQILHLQ